MTEAFWTAPRLWDSGACFILGGGPGFDPSLAERLVGARVIAVNNAYHLGPWPVMLYGDCQWWHGKRNAAGIVHKQALASFAGLKVHPCKNGCKPLGVRIMMRRNQPFGIQRSPDRLAWNLNSGACAINLAVHFGVRRIILLGFDMHSVDGQPNWHKEHGPRNKNFEPWPRYLQVFPAIAADLKALGIECINATPGSAIREFPIIDPEGVLPC